MTDGNTARIVPATVDDIDPVADLWIALAEGQRQHGSTLLAEENHAAVREWVARSVVTGELLVARICEETNDGTGTEADTQTTRSVTDSIGFVSFTIDHGGYEREQTRGTVGNLFVVPDYRGKGVGSALLGEAEQALREAGAEVVALEALADNTHARTFYAAHGFEQHRVELTKPLSAENTVASEADCSDVTEKSD